MKNLFEKNKSFDIFLYHVQRNYFLSILVFETFIFTQTSARLFQFNFACKEFL